MSLLGFTHLFQDTGSSCPTITLGDMQPSSELIVGTATGIGALITGGTPGYTINLIAGSYPDGLTASITEFSGSYYFSLQGTPTTFGSYTFTISVTDANGCVSNNDAYTVYVGKSFTGSQIDTHVAQFSVSGLPSTYGTGVSLSRVVLNATADGGANFKDSPSVLRSPNDNALSLWLETDITGSSLTGTNVYSSDSGETPISSGSTPYTGNFSALYSPYSGFNGDSANGTWQIEFDGINVTYGTIKLIFMPI